MRPGSYLFLYALFKDAIYMYEYTVSNGSMVSD